MGPLGIVKKVGGFFRKSLDTTGSSGPDSDSIVDAVGKALGKKKYSKPMSDDSYIDYHKGGTVKKTGLAKVHKGEKVLTKAQARKAPRKRV